MVDALQGGELLAGSALVGMGDQSHPEQGNSVIRHFRVRVEASGYARVQGRTKAEAIRNARRGDFIRTPRPEWNALVSDVKEIQR